MTLQDAVDSPGCKASLKRMLERSGLYHKACYEWVSACSRTPPKGPSSKRTCLSRPQVCNHRFLNKEISLERTEIISWGSLYVSVYGNFVYSSPESSDICACIIQYICSSNSPAPEYVVSKKQCSGDLLKELFPNSDEENEKPTENTEDGCSSSNTNSSFMESLVTLIWLYVCATATLHMWMLLKIKC